MLLLHSTITKTKTKTTKTNFMKKATISGFNYSINDQKKVTNNADNSEVKQTGKGTKATVELTADGTHADFEAGSAHTFKVDELFAAYSDSMVEETAPDAEFSLDTENDPTGEATGNEAKLTPEEQEAADKAKADKEAADKAKAEAALIATRKKELKKQIAEKTTAMIDATEIEKILAIKGEVTTLKAELEALEASEKEPEFAPTEAQAPFYAAFVAARVAYEDAKEYFEQLKKEAQDAQKNATENGIPAKEVKLTGTTASTGTHSSPSISITDEIAQDIRRDYALGRTFNEAGDVVAEDEKAEKVSVIAERYGCSPATVMFKVYYLQHKLRRGQIAYTPRINKFYNAETGFAEGAPFFEEGIKETQGRYILPEKRLERNEPMIAVK